MERDKIIENTYEVLIQDSNLLTRKFSSVKREKKKKNRKITPNQGASSLFGKVVFQTFFQGRISILCNTDILQGLKVVWHSTYQNPKQIKNMVELWRLNEYSICCFLLRQTWNKVKLICNHIILLFSAILIWVLWKYFKCKNVWNTLWTHIHSLSRFILSKNIPPQGGSFFFIF